MRDTAGFRNIIRTSLLAAGILALLGFAAPLSAAQDDAEKPAKGFGTTQQRHDRVFGTMDEGLRTGRDPETGDNIMRVEPAPKKQQDYEIPPITVEPNVKIPPQGN